MATRSRSGATNQPVETWHDLTSCPANADGLRGLHVEYDRPGHDETLVAGHPVDLSLFFDGSARLVRIEIKTKDQTSLYMRKKAYRLGIQAKEHYGDGNLYRDIFNANTDVLTDPDKIKVGQRLRIP